MNVNKNSKLNEKWHNINWNDVSNYIKKLTETIGGGVQE